MSLAIAISALAALRGGSRTLLRSAIPFILAGGTAGGGTNQFTMGDNGALSTLPALPTTYSGGAFIYMPANGIFAGSAAGWYWFIASSTTAGTVYNNTYTTGEPRLAVPSSPTPFVTTGPGVVTQVTTEVISVETRVNAGAMGPNGVLRWGSQFSNINNANSKTHRHRLSSTSGSTGTTLQGGNATASVGLGAFGAAHNRNAENRQIALNGNNGTYGTPGQVIYASINTAADAFFLITLQLASATDYIVLEATLLEVLYGA